MSDRNSIYVKTCRQPQYIVNLELPVLNIRILLGDVDSAPHATHLGGKDATLLCGSSTADNSGIAVEVLGNLLEWGVAGLDVELPDNGKLDGQPTAVDNVVLPADVAEGHRVDVLVEEESEIDAEEHGGHTLGANIVWQDFDRVSDEQAGVGHVVEHVVDEDHGNDSSSCCSLLVLVELGGADGPDYEADQHASSRNEEESSAANLVDEEALSDGDNGIANLQDTVDDELCGCVRDSNSVKDEVQVVRDKTC